MTRAELTAAIEDAVRDAAQDFGHPLAVDTIGDAVTEILEAVDAYLALPDLKVALEYVCSDVIPSRYEKEAIDRVKAVFR